MSIDPKNLSETAVLTFSEEFNGNSLDFGYWNTGYPDAPIQGGSNTKNKEEQWYLNAAYGPTADLARETYVVKDGMLHIVAQPTPDQYKQYVEGYGYTSGLITTHSKFEQAYGYFEMRADIPEGQGMWPAFWLLRPGGWPPEIDVMEVVGKKPDELVTTIHSKAGGNYSMDGHVTVIPGLSQGMQTYGVNWQPDTITWYFNGEQVYQTNTPADMHDPMYMLVNLAVGGTWPGSPDETTEFPAAMKVDYVRAYTEMPEGAVVNLPAAASEIPQPAGEVLAALEPEDLEGALQTDESDTWVAAVEGEAEAEVDPSDETMQMTETEEAPQEALQATVQVASDDAPDLEIHFEAYHGEPEGEGTSLPAEAIAAEPTDDVFATITSVPVDTDAPSWVALEQALAGLGEDRRSNNFEKLAEKFLSKAAKFQEKGEKLLEFGEKFAAQSTKFTQKAEKLDPTLADKASEPGPVQVTETGGATTGIETSVTFFVGRQTSQVFKGNGFEVSNTDLDFAFKRIDMADGKSMPFKDFGLSDFSLDKFFADGIVEQALSQQAQSQALELT
jgi:beta-glucanase (GH16 family)